MKQHEYDDDDSDDKVEGAFYTPPANPLMVKIREKDLNEIHGSPFGDPEKIVIMDLKNIMKRLEDFNYNYDEDEDIITLVGRKPETIAKFKFEDLDKGLVDEEVRDILNEYELRRLPSEYADKSIEKIYSKLEKVQNI